MSEITTTTTRWDELTEAGRQAVARGDVSAAFYAHRGALEEAEASAPDSARVASSLASLGQLNYQMKAYGEAEDLFRRALALRERLLGAEHPNVAQTLNNLAAVHVARGALDAAEPLLLRALAITERHRGPSHADVAVNLNNLAKLYFKRSEHARAEPLLERLLDIEKASNPKHPKVAGVLTSLATVKLALGAPSMAEGLLRQALAMRGESGQGEDATLATTLESLADACKAQGNRDAAITERERALAIRERLVGATHPSVAAARARLEALRNGRATPAETTASVPTPSAIPQIDVRATPAGVPETAPHRPSGALPPNPWLAEAEPPSVIAAESGEVPATPVPEPDPVAIVPSVTVEPIASAIAPSAPVALPPIVVPPQVKREFDDAWGRESSEAPSVVASSRASVEMRAPAAEPPPAVGIAAPVLPSATPDLSSSVVPLPKPTASVAPMPPIPPMVARPPIVEAPSARPSPDLAAAAAALARFAPPPAAVVTESIVAETEFAPMALSDPRTNSFGPPPAPMASVASGPSTVPTTSVTSATSATSATPTMSAMPAAPRRSSGATVAPTVPAEPAPGAERARPAPRKPRLQHEGTAHGGGMAKLAIAAAIVALVGGGAWFALQRGGTSTAEASPPVETVPAATVAPAPEVTVPAPGPAASPATASAESQATLPAPEEDEITSSPVPVARRSVPAPAPRVDDAARKPDAPRVPMIGPIRTDQITGSIDSTAKKLDASLKPKVSQPVFRPN
jgi:tetratricopeptide (TPR) repeat protein